MTRTMVVRAARHDAAVGQEAAVADVNEPGAAAWTAMPHYVHMFAMTADGHVLADDVWPEFVGTDFTLVADFEGFRFGEALLDGTPADESVFQFELTFINADSDAMSPSVGSCLRPVPEQVLCSWANG